MKTHSEVVWETVQSRSSAALSALAASWCRSVFKHGLDPATPRRNGRVTSCELDRAREAETSLLRPHRHTVEAINAKLRIG